MCIYKGRFRCQRGLSCGSAAARMLKLRFRIPVCAWTSGSCECCVLSGRNICVGVVTSSREVLASVCVSVCLAVCVCMCVCVCEQVQQ